MNAYNIDTNTRLVPKLVDGDNYLLTTWDDPQANVWSLEQKADDGLWRVKADFYDRDMALRHTVPSFMDIEEARAGAFVVAGALEHHDFTDAVRNLDEGELGIIERLVLCGKLTEKVWQEYKEDNVDVDFVWDYEVCVRLGARVVEHLRLGGNKWPDDGIIMIWTRQLSAAAGPNPNSRA